MTLLEKVIEMGEMPVYDKVNNKYPKMCPHSYDLESKDESVAACLALGGDCAQCYSRKYISTATPDPTANPVEAKYDAGKLRPTLVPMQIVYDIAEVREYGTRKYHDPENWRNVELERYVNAFLRHALALAHDITAKDAESGIEHYKHAACNLAFIAEMLKAKGGADYDC